MYKRLAFWNKYEITDRNSRERCMEGSAGGPNDSEILFLKKMRTIPCNGPTPMYDVKVIIGRLAQKSSLVRMLAIFILLFNLSNLRAQDADAIHYADSVLSELTLDERIGQLFVERVFSKDKNKDGEQIKKKIKKYGIGGVCFFQGNPIVQAELTQEFQALSKVPMFISMDAEWGLGMRFKKEAFSFPKQMTLGAVRDDKLVYRVAKRIGEHCQAVDVNVNFAPVADINNNPKNPVIHYRSFGENRFHVAMKTHQFCEGLMASGVMPCVKHFPGHGDTDMDSHYDLPKIHHDRNRLDSVELFPFEVMSHLKVPSMMAAHLEIPALDSTDGIPATLSKQIITDLLRKEMSYDGLVFTDAMEMKGVTDHFGPAEAAVRAFEAGNDIILLSTDIDKAFNAMKSALDSGRISVAEINDRVFRILKAKYRFAQFKPKSVSSGILKQINNQQDELLSFEVYSKAITLLKRRTEVIPIANIADRSFASISIGAKTKTEFQKIISKYVPAAEYQIGYSNSEATFKDLEKRLEGKDVVIIGLHDMSYSASKNFGLTNNVVGFLNRMAASESSVILSVFGTPYALEYLVNMPNVLACYEDNELVQSATAQAIFGASSIAGMLPVTASSEYQVGNGIITRPLGRLGYAPPEAVGMSSDSLAKIEELVGEIIKKKAAPGCQILVAKNGKIVYEKSFGHYTYEKKRPVSTTTLFDLASITKIAATTASIMKLHSDYQLSVYDPLQMHLKSTVGTNKAGITIDQILAHHARLKPWIPFYTNTLTEERRPKPSDKWYRKTAEGEFTIPVTERLFMKTEYVDSVYFRILDSDLRERSGYRYSDIGMYLLRQLVENTTKVGFDRFAEEEFYKPLGMHNTLFNPTKRYSIEACAPTEEDGYFRCQRIQGYVHDMGASMLGGVSGHAGLFSTSHDMGIMMQMFLNGGYYGGKYFMEASTVQLFTRRYQGSSRRGLGFDMKELNPDRTASMCKEASSSTFGHTGFTGTCAWADPEENLIFIFLSNRTYPDMKNNKLAREDYRPKLQSLVYRSITQPNLVP